MTTAVDIHAICGRVALLCRRIVPLDLGDAPLYIVLQSHLPDDLGGKALCDGFTAPSLDLYLKDSIEPAWHGRGACMVVNDTDFPEKADDAESAVVAIVLHELAHILERPALYRDRQGDDAKWLPLEALCMGNAVSREKPVTEAMPPYEGHGHRFIRAALHLRHRAEAAGVLVPLLGYCAGNQYGLSHPNRYREALGDEPARLAALSIREILAMPYPTKFWRLWTTDVAHGLFLDFPSSKRSFCYGYRHFD